MAFRSFASFSWRAFSGQYIQTFEYSKRGWAAWESWRQLLTDHGQLHRSNRTSQTCLFKIFERGKSTGVSGPPSQCFSNINKAYTVERTTPTLFGNAAFRFGAKLNRSHLGHGCGKGGNGSARKFCTESFGDAEGLRKTRQASPLIGLVAGVVGSIVGVGGGTLIVPMVANFCKSIPQRVISGTSLAAVISTGTVSTINYGSSQSVDFTAALIISSAAVLAAPFGARMTMVLDNNSLKRVLGYFLMAASLAIPLKLYFMPTHASTAPTVSNTENTTQDKSSLEFEWPSPAKTTMLAGTGVVAGFASGLLGIGGGTIVTPLLAVATTLPQTHVLGTSLCAMIPPAIVGLLQHRRLGNVDWVLATGLTAGTLVGGFVGSSFALWAPEPVLQGVFAVAMFGMGRMTLAKARLQPAAQRTFRPGVFRPVALVDHVGQRIHKEKFRKWAKRSHTLTLEEVSPELILSQQLNLPPVRNCLHFVNLTNGLEMLPYLEEHGLPHNFVRIQSTACEQNRLEPLMLDLDANFLMNLALGRCCIVCDMGSRMVTGQPSALWYGLEFIRFALRYLWFGRVSRAFLKGRNVTGYFHHEIRNFPKPSKKKLRYYKRYIPEGVEDVQVYGVFKPTMHDSNDGFYEDMARRYCPPVIQNTAVGENGIHGEDWGNARWFWEERGFRLHGGGVCQSQYEKLFTGNAEWTEMGPEFCSFSNVGVVGKWRENG